MSNSIKLIAASFFLTVIVSCSNDGAGQGHVSTSLPKQGVIREKMECAGAAGKSYALFIPSFAPPHAERVESGRYLYPVIISFDPHGSGLLPLTMYKDLAEKFGYILVGSNDSKTGLAGEQIKEIVTALMHEVRSLYPVDTNRICIPPQNQHAGGRREAGVNACAAIGRFEMVETKNWGVRSALCEVLAYLSLVCCPTTWVQSCWHGDRKIKQPWPS